jgi:hypothetical protein
VISERENVENLTGYRPKKAMHTNPVWMFYCSKYTVTGKRILFGCFITQSMLSPAKESCLDVLLLNVYCHWQENPLRMLYCSKYAVTGKRILFGCFIAQSLLSLAREGSSPSSLLVAVKVACMAADQDI